MLQCRNVDHVVCVQCCEEWTSVVTTCVCVAYLSEVISEHIDLCQAAVELL